MSEVFGSCGDKFVTWDDTLFDENGRPMVRFTSAEGDETLDICLDPVKGAVIVDTAGNETEVEVVDGVLQLGDMFGQVELSGTPGEADYTATVTFPGQEPFDICLSPQKGTVDSDGNDLVNENGVAEIPAYVQSVTGPGVDNDDPQNPVIGQSSFSVDVDAGTITHTSADGTQTTANICDLIANCVASIVPGPGPNEYTFDNGFGGTQVIQVNEIDMDINELVVAGSVVNWTTEDGTTGSFDICAIVAANCNSPMELRPDGSVVYTDNAGVMTTIPAPPRFTDVTGAPVALQPDGSICVTPGITDCDGGAIIKGDQIVRKVLDPQGVPLPTDGMGNQQMPCIVKDIALVKSALPGPYEEGDVVDYTFIVTNTGTVDLTNVTITDDQVTVVGGPIDLAVGASDSTTFTAQYTYTADDVANEGLINTAVVTGVAPDGTVVSDMDDASIFNLAPPEMPAIMLTKTITSGDGPYREGDTIEYAFVVSNTGDVSLTGVVVTDPLLTVVGGPIALAVGAMDNSTFTGSYVVTAEDATAGVVNNTAATEGTSPAGAVVTDEDSASAPAEEVTLVKRCATLPEIQLDRVLTASSNLQTNAVGDSYNTDSVSDFVTPGGVVLAIGTVTVALDDYSGIHPEGSNTGTGPDTLITGEHPAGWIVDTSFWTDSAANLGNGATSGTAQMQLDIAPGANDGSVQGCASEFRTEIVLHDVDNQSVVSGLSRPWDTERQDFQPSTTPYTDNGDGSFFFPNQSQWYLFWETATRTDSVSLTYQMGQQDGVLMSQRVFWTPAVCVMEDADGNIVSAETIDGPLDPARYGDLTFV